MDGQRVFADGSFAYGSGATGAYVAVSLQETAEGAAVGYWPVEPAQPIGVTEFHYV